MNLITVLFLTILYGILILLTQRTEARRRLVVGILLTLVLVLVHALANSRGVGGESTTALIAALILNLLFWVLVGRYNPVGSSDDIHVIGMDD